MFVSPEFHTLGYNVYMCIYRFYINFINIVVIMFFELYA